LAGEDARLKAGLKSAEDELNLIKNQIQQTLLDIREHILDVTNPFNNAAADMLDDDEEVAIEEGAGDLAGVGEAAGGGDGSDSAMGEELPEEPSLEEELPLDDLLGGDEYGDEIEEIPDDELMGGDGGGGGGGGGGLSDLFEPEDELEAAEDGADEGFELEDEEEKPEEQPQPESLEEDKVEEPMSQDELPQDKPSGDPVAEAAAAALIANVDLLTMASLVRWTAVTRDRIGANRLDILLDAYEMAGRISPAMKNVIKTLSALGDEDGDGIPVRDVVTAMVRMEGVLNTGPARDSNRLLGLLLEMDDDPLDRLVA
jgi:hypothetical protein